MFALANLSSSFNKSTRRANHFGLSKIASSPSDQNISVFQKQKTGYMFAIPSHSEGHCKVTSAGRDAVDADGAPDQSA
jgi:hypothetical protein